MLPGWCCKFPVHKFFLSRRKWDLPSKNNLEMVLLKGRSYNVEGTGNWQQKVKCALVGYVRGKIKELILPEKLGVGARPASQNPLFMTKICDFPYPVYDLTKNLIPYLWPDSKINIIRGTAFVAGFIWACVAGVKRSWGRQSADGRRKAWWRSSFF